MPRAPVSSRTELLSPAQARRLFAYNERVFHRFARAVRKLPWRQATRHREIGHQSLFETLVHILNVHEVWVGYILPGRNSDPELEALFQEPSRRPSDWRGFAVYEKRVWTLVRRYLDRVSSRDLGRPVRAFWMPGRYCASDGLLQSTFEQAHHLGEIIGALWQQDTAPPEMTWIRVGDLRTARRR
jgi:uncharacterized damage-inducible protein DinB